MGYPIGWEQIIRSKGLIPLDTPAPVALETSEKAFQRAVTDEAERRGWKWHHQTISKRSKSGWPDLVLMRERIIFAELKSESGTLEAEQANWRDRIQLAGGEWYLWRPSMWCEIVEVLT